MPTLSPMFEEFLPAWVAAQRWYRGKAGCQEGGPRLRRLASIRWQDPLGEVGLEDHLVVDESGPEPVVYQIPLSYRAEPVDFMAEALVATAEHSDLGTRYIYDATHDPVFVQTLLQHIYGDRDVPSGRARRLVAGGRAPALRAARVLSGEQSNTSIIVEAHGETRPVIMKIFRVLGAGENPEVSVASAIAPTGNRSIPGPIGYVEGRWPDADGQEVNGHLAFVQEFLPDTEDAWRTALRAARDDEDWSGRARELGATTASVHASLREAFGPQDADPASRITLVDQMRARAAAALAEVPELEEFGADIDATYDELEHLDLPALQRIHGDYHLGQVLDTPGRGWIMLDFEGEPLRPLDERTMPDLALRDVAGMLRSFDYAAATIAQESGDSRDAWATAAREAFLEGYATSSGEDLNAADSRRLLDALELDKALYEVVYESRNRPDWVPIPVGAVRRLVEKRRQGTGTGPGPEAGAGTDGGGMASTVAPGRHREERAELEAVLEGDAEDVQTSTPAPLPSLGAQLRDLDPAVHGPHTQDPEGNGAPRAGADSTDPVSGATAAALAGAGFATGGIAGEGLTTGESTFHAVPSEVPDAVDLAEDESEDEPEDTANLDDAAEPTSAHSDGDDGGTADDATDADADADDAERDGDDAFAAPSPVAQHPDLTRASGGGASGGVPHEPVPAPAHMRGSLEPAAPVQDGVEPPPSVDENPVDEAVTYPAASGLAPRDGNADPVESRDRAWRDAESSPAVVTGSRETTVTRIKLDSPQQPTAPHTRPLDLDEATDVVYGLHRNPHTVLGAHVHDGHVTIRTVQPDATGVSVVLPDGERVAMTHETGGIWVAVLPQEQVPTYRLHVEDRRGSRVVDEAYRHGPTLGDLDLHLFGEGRHEQLWTILGSHVRTVRDEMGQTTGTHFAVWAPNALAVHVIGDFNGWDGNRHALRVHEDVGVWELFVPGVEAGAHYKYDITGPDGTRRAKADPMARATEVPPFNNSVVTDSTHRWQDQEWMERRAQTDPHHGPMSIYEVHLGSWRPGLKYEELADQLVDYVRDLGFTHVEFMPVMQHPYGPSWGYHVTGYYAADSRFGHEDGLRYLIDRMHQAGIGVILDWVPGHFATDPWALARFDGTPIYEHPDPRKGWHPEWGSYIFDYGSPQVRNFLVANATYWLEEFHADGLRVDGVASMLYLDYSREPGQWIPNEHGGRENLEAVSLLQETNATAYRRSPGVMMIAEESTSWPGVTESTDQGGLGFGFKWNMGWMHDTLGYLALSPHARGRAHHSMTFSIVYAYSEKYILPISHDEVVHGKGSLVRKMWGDAWQKFATTRAFLAYQWSHPGKQLLFMGAEFGQAREWADGGSLQWELTDQPYHAGIQRLVGDLNRLYHEVPSLWQIDHHEHGFTWLDANDAGRNTYSYLRWGDEGQDGLRPVVAVLVNFSGMTQGQVHVGLPYGGRWREVLNTDAEIYGGAGVGNMGHIQAFEVEHERQPYSALVTVPAMGAVWLVPDPEPEDDAPAVASEDFEEELEEVENTPIAELESEPPLTEGELEAAQEEYDDDVAQGLADLGEPEEDDTSAGQVSEVSGLGAVAEAGGDLPAEVTPTAEADTDAIGGLDREQAHAADGDLDARPEVEIDPEATTDAGARTTDRD